MKTRDSHEGRVSKHFICKRFRYIFMFTDFTHAVSLPVFQGSAHPQGVIASLGDNHVRLLNLYLNTPI